MKDATVQKSITINTPASRVFDFLVQPEKIPLVLPGLLENFDIPQLPLAIGSSFGYRYQMSGVMLEGRWIVQELDRPRVYAAVTDGDVPSEWRYELSEEGDRTRVDIRVRYEPPQSVLSRVKTDVLLRINEQEAESLLSNLKTVLEMDPA